MASPEYSKAILTGLEKHGVLPAGAALITRLPESKILAISRKKAHFTDGNLEAIENAIGLTAGQLALASVDNPDAGIIAVMNGWASVRSSIRKQKPKRRVSR